MGELGWELHHPMKQMEPLYDAIYEVGKKEKITLPETLAGFSNRPSTRNHFTSRLVAGQPYANIGICHENDTKIHIIFETSRNRVYLRAFCVNFSWLLHAPCSFIVFL